MSSTSLTGEKIAGWRIIHTAVVPELPANPHLVERHGTLGYMIVEGDDLQVRQKALISELRTINRRRRELAVEGEDLRNRLAAALRFEHGFTNEKLLGYGVKPRRTVRRSPPNEEPPLPETPKTPEATETSAQ
jgi:hypothetical protein